MCQTDLSIEETLFEDTLKVSKSSTSQLFKGQSEF